jgi:hypothetical protein
VNESQNDPKESFDKMLEAMNLLNKKLKELDNKVKQLENLASNLDRIEKENRNDKFNELKE